MLFLSHLTLTCDHLSDFLLNKSNFACLIWQSVINRKEKFLFYRMKPPAEVGSYHSPESIYCSMNPHQKLSGWKSDYQEAIKSENLGKKGIVCWITQELHWKSMETCLSDGSKCDILGLNHRQDVQKPGQRSNNANIQPSEKHSGGSFMVWAAFQMGCFIWQSNLLSFL